MNWQIRIAIWFFILMVAYALYYFNSTFYRTELYESINKINKALTTTREMYSQIPFDELNKVTKLLQPQNSVLLPHTGNVIINGDFEKDSIDFETSYQILELGNFVSFTYEQKGWIFVDTLISNELAWKMQSKKSKNNLLIVDGAVQPNKVFWRKEVVVKTNTHYVFSFKIQNVVAQVDSVHDRWQKALVAIKFNGKILGYAQAPNPYSGEYTYYIKCNSLESNKMLIELIDINTVGVYNDFAVDDICLQIAPNGYELHEATEYTIPIIAELEKKKIFEDIFSQRLSVNPRNLKYKLVYSSSKISSEKYYKKIDTVANRLSKRFLSLERDDTLHSVWVPSIKNNEFVQCLFSNYGSVAHYNLSYIYKLSIALLLLIFLAYWLLEINAIRQKKIINYKYDMLGNVAHEIKTPLAGIIASAEALKDYKYYEDKQKLSQYVGFVYNQSLKLSNLTERVLNQYRSLTNLKPNFTIINVKHNLQQIIDNYYYPTKKTNSINLICNDSKISIKADASYFKNIINTIIDNSYKYSNNEIIIDVKVYSDAKNVSIEIIDNGVGIEKSKQKHVFKKHYRANINNDLASGYGLGLYYVKDIVKIHNGEIVVDSDGKTYTKIILKFKMHA